MATVARHDELRRSDPGRAGRRRQRTAGSGHWCGYQGGRIAAIGDLSAAEAGQEIDAAGQVVAPGFIDIHTHSDLAHFVDPQAVAMDMMPTNWNHTAATALLPAWAFELSNEELVVEEQWDQVRLLTSSANPNLVGRTIADLTAEGNTAGGWEVLFDLLVGAGKGLKGMMLTSRAFAEEDNQMVLEHPLCSVESDPMPLANDGPLSGQVFGLLGYNWVPRLLAHYVRDEGVLDLEEGVRRLTGLPADRIGLSDRRDQRQVLRRA